MLRTLVVPFVMLSLLLGGCLSDVAVDCDGVGSQTLFVAPNHELTQAPPASDAVRLGGTTDGFVGYVNPFGSGDFDGDIVISGDVQIELWLSSEGSLSPVVAPSGDGYAVYNLFGSNQTLMPTGEIEQGPVVDDGSEILHIQHSLATPPGGFVLPAGQSVSLMIASLVIQANPELSGHDVLVGEQYPSRVSFDYRCVNLPDLVDGQAARAPVFLPGNTGLFSDLVPEESDWNVATVAFQLKPDTRKLTISLREAFDDAVKDDMDLALVDPDGMVVWTANSPQQDETMVLWENNLAVVAPPGNYTVAVRSYSGTAYQGELVIRQDA